MNYPGVFPKLFWIAFLLAASAVAQLDQIPTCALSCAITSLGATGCPQTDFACICQSTEFISGLAPCIQSSCTQEDRDQTLRAAQLLCANAGIDLSISSDVPSSTRISSSTSSSTSTSTSTSSPTLTSTNNPILPPSQIPSRTTTSTAPDTTSSESSSTSITTSSNTPTINSVPSTNSNNLSSGVIAGIAVGAGVLVISLIVCLYIIYRLRDRKKPVPAMSSNGSTGNHHNQWGGIVQDNWGGIGPDNDLPGQLVTGGRN
ncbi:hypothetical protein TWF506_003575 [Arthrobotrys conoides]|uniref:CFEM domain-containing protein n=1 Tax=Arthrobotrys conoides TaxID=74498 RepID=A0AAN8NBD7_9PEZI